MVIRTMMALFGLSLLVVANPAAANSKVIITKEQPRSQSRVQSRAQLSKPFLSPYFAAGAGTGGDTVSRFSGGFRGSDRVRAGGGFFLEGGVVLTIAPLTQLRLTGGYEIDGTSRFIGDSTFDRVRFDAVLLRNFGIHDLGIGLTGHTGVGFDCDIVSVCSSNVDFDSAVGYTLEYGINPYGYNFGRKSRRRASSFQGVRFGLRFTDIDYRPEAGSDLSIIDGVVDGKSLSGFFGFSF